MLSAIARRPPSLVSSQEKKLDNKNDAFNDAFLILQSCQTLLRSGAQLQTRINFFLDESAMSIEALNGLVTPCLYELHYVLHILFYMRMAKVYNVLEGDNRVSAFIVTSSTDATKGSLLWLPLT